MTGTEIELPVVDGVLSGVDFGGHGEGVLLVHGSGHNAAAWMDVPSHLVSECHPIALDLRGHGQTPLDSTHPESTGETSAASSPRWPGTVPCWSAIPPAGTR